MWFIFIGFIAMVIVGIFIVGRLEEQQIMNITNNMEKHIEPLLVVLVISPQMIGMNIEKRYKKL